MQNTSDLYKELLAGAHSVESRLAVGTKDTPISFPRTFYTEDQLVKMETVRKCFAGEQPSVGSCTSGEITVTMLYPETEPPRHAKIVPQIRLTDGERCSEWISKGVFYIDTRKHCGVGSGVETLTFTGFDAMLMAEQDYPSSTLMWPAKDIDVVREIAQFIGVDIDPRTVALMTGGYDIQYPGGQYSCRETLGYIAAMYGGSFVMSDIGELRLVTLNSMPKATRYLVDNTGAAITFGGVRILV